MHKRDGNDRWEVLRKDQLRQLVNGLMNDEFTTRKYDRGMFLGSHLMNDPNFKESSNNKQKGDTNEIIIEPNCVV